MQFAPSSPFDVTRSLASNLFIPDPDGAQIMNLDELMKLVRSCAAQMNAQYGQPVFDEWAVISLLHNQARVLGYVGPRNDAFLKNFADDLSPLRAELLDRKYQAGDFEFARHSTGTKFEAFIMLGEGIYLICNNTQSTMDKIAQDPKWLSAQVPFAELSDKVRSSPLTLA
jgi:hypothetical protein